MRRRFPDQQAEHFGLCLKLHQRELDGLIDGQRLTKGLALLGVFDRFIDAILRRAQRGGRLANTIFMDEMLRNRKALIQRSKHGRLRHPDIGVGTFRMVGRHVERPQIFANLKARRVGGHDEAGDAARLAIIAIGAGKGHDMRCDMQARRPHFIAINAIAGNAVAHFRHGARIHMRGVRPMIFFGQAKGPAHPPGEHFGNEVALLLLRTKVAQHQNLHQIADDGAFILQIIMQPQPLGGEVMADHRHGEI